MHQLGRNDHEALFQAADAISRLERKACSELLAGRVLVSAFFQNSTRTRISHESAMLHCGGAVTGFADARATRAGDFFEETLEDVGRMLANYGDVIVLRHPTTGAAAALAKVSKTPIINAGDGWGEHPTQALTDLYTIRDEFGSLDGRKIALVGDLRMRTMHSLLIGLQQYDCEVFCVSPDDMRLGDSYRDDFASRGNKISEFPDVSSVLPMVDVCYVEPVVQPDYSIGRQTAPQQKTDTPDAFRISRRVLQERARDELIVLHSLPRQSELPVDVDDTPYNRYWREAELGVVTRMALLSLMLGD